MTLRILASVASARRRHWSLSLTALIALLLAPLADANAQPASTEPTSTEPQVAAEPLRVLSYNIRHSRGLDDQLDLPRIAAVIRSVSPDLVALQEVDQNVQRSGGVDQLAELAKLTGMHGVFGANIDLQGGKYGNAILSRFPITGSHNQLLPSFDNGEQRGVLSATVQAPAPLGDLTLLATHLDYRRDPRERLASVDAIAELLAKRPGLPTLLAGDMNALPDSDTLQRLADHWQPTNTGTLPTVPAAAPKRQIDFILTAPADGWEVIETRVLDEPVASDHRPVFSVLRWRAGESPVNQATAATRQLDHPLQLPTDISDQQRIQQMEAIADLALIAPHVNTDPLPEYHLDRLDYGMTIGMERTPGGRLWACWVGGGDSPLAYFLLASSDDNGQTWTQPRVVVDGHRSDLPVHRSILVGNLWTDPLGRLWLIFDQSMDMYDGRAGVWATICENPDADQPTWSPPQRLWHGVTLNKPTVLASGEWMLPISLDQRPGFGPFIGCFAELDPDRGANVLVSADQGASWQRRGKAVFPNPDWHEHMIVERRDGTLWMLARNAKGVMESVSSDGGHSWSEPQLPAQIRQPNARFHLRRLASGNILLIKHGDQIDSHQGRVQLSAWLSPDDGQSWQGGLILDERRGISYPDGVQAADGTIYISYDRNRSTDGEILMARFSEADVLAKQLLTDGSQLKMLISRPAAGDGE